MLRGLIFSLLKKTILLPLDEGVVESSSMDKNSTYLERAIVNWIQTSSDKIAVSDCQNCWISLTRSTTSLETRTKSLQFSEGTLSKTQCGRDVFATDWTPLLC